MNSPRLAMIATVGLSLFLLPIAHARPYHWHRQRWHYRYHGDYRYDSHHPVLATQELRIQTVAGPRLVSVGFSPEGSAEALVLKVIESAHRAIRVSAYDLTSAPIVRALIAARRRGVSVEVVADAKANTEGRAYGERALASLENAGIPVRTVSVYAIHHDKVIIADDSVETGSFNYSRAAARENSENVIVLWNDPTLAQLYLQHWRSRWNQGLAFHPDGAVQPH
jgi:phosphatidylserine/phosphatidylglycerophosphate/cardiolipin synthase-like enzyme